MGLNQHHPIRPQGGNGRRGADGRMHVIRPLVGGLHGFRHGLATGTHLGFGVDEFVGLGFAQPLKDALMPRQHFVDLPLGQSGHGLGGGQCLFFTLGHHTQEAAIAHGLDHARHFLHRRQIDRQQLGLVGRWTHDVAKQHARRTLFLHKHGLTQHLGRQVHPVHRVADVAMAVCRLGLDKACGLAVERFARDQVPIRHLLTTDGADHAVVHAQGVEGLFEFFSRQVEQDGTHLGRGMLNGSAAVRHGERACGHALVGHQGGVARDDLHTRQVDVEFVRANLRDGGQDALPQLHLAHEQGDGLVGVDAQPRVEFAVGVQVAGQARFVGDSCRLRQGRIQRNAKGQRDIARGFQEATTGGGECVVHDQAPFAARRTARTMRLWAPQRHKLPSRAERTSASVGLGLRSSKAWACTIMPEVQ